MADNDKSQDNRNKLKIIAIIIALLILALLAVKLFGGKDDTNSNQQPNQSASNTDSTEPLKTSFVRGEVGKFDNFEFKINHVSHGWSEEESVIGGEELIVIDLSITNTDDEEAEIPKYTVKVKDSQSVTSVYSSQTVPGDRFEDLIRFQPGETLTGQYAFSVPADEHELELIYVTRVDDPENPATTKEVNFSLDFQWHENRSIILD